MLRCSYNTPDIEEQLDVPYGGKMIEIIAIPFIT